MRRTLLVSLAVAGLAGSGCTSMKDAQALNKQVEAMGTQLAAQEQKIGDAEKTITGLKDEIAALKKKTDELKLMADNQARTNVRLGALLSEARRGGPQPGGEEPGAGQPGNRGQDWRQRQMDQMGERLKLSDDQKEKVKAALAKSEETLRKTMEDMRQPGQQPDRDKMREAWNKNRTETEEAVKKILTAEQFAEYEKLRDQIMQRGPGRGGGRWGGGDRRGGDRPGGDRPQGGDRPAGGEKQGGDENL